jgi:formylglycine-generating enzyme required for sulfatase activity
VIARRVLFVLGTVLAGCGGAADDGAADAMPPLDPAMVRFPAGALILGSDDGAADERPVRTVELAAFDLDRREVTQAEWQACRDAGACTAVLCQESPYWSPTKYPEHPALCMSHDQAQAYCAWRGKRLPSEAEWERAARGAAGRAYAWGDAAPDCARANADGCGGDPAPVGSRPDGATPEGVLDLTGNVREWVADWYAADAYATGEARDPRGPASGSERVVRGGGFVTGADGLRAAARDKLVPLGGAYDLGLRCAR